MNHQSLNNNLELSNQKPARLGLWIFATVIGVVGIMVCAAAGLVSLYYFTEQQDTEQNLIAEITEQASDFEETSTRQAELMETRLAEVSNTLTAVSDELTVVSSTLRAVEAAQTSTAQAPVIGATQEPTEAPPDATPRLPATALAGSEFEDISSSGTWLAISDSDDELSPVIPLGFSFTFYDETYTSVYASTNGFLTFLSNQDSGCCSGDQLPSSDVPDGVVAGFWTDLSPSKGGDIYYQTIGSAPARRFILQFHDICDYEGCDQRITFQIKLFEGSDVIEIHHLNHSFITGSSDHVSIGIENQTGDRGIQSFFWNSSETITLDTPSAIAFSPPYNTAPGDPTTQPPTNAMVSDEFEDISATGFLLDISDADDAVSTAVPIGFSFDYDGQTFSSVYASTNGFLTFLSNQDDGCCSGDLIPATADPNGVVAAFWTDLSPGLGGEVYYQTLGSAPDRYFILQFDEVCDMEGCEQMITFQIKLFENNGNIEIHYAANSFLNGSRDDISIGIENLRGTRGVQSYFWDDEEEVDLPMPLKLVFSPPFFD